MFNSDEQAQYAHAKVYGEKGYRLAKRRQDEIAKMADEVEKDPLRMTSPVQSNSISKMWLTLVFFPGYTYI